MNDQERVADYLQHLLEAGINVPAEVLDAIDRLRGLKDEIEFHKHRIAMHICGEQRK